MSTVPEITVVTDIRHPRLRYVLDIVGNDLGYRFRFFNDRSVFGSPAPRYGVRYGGGGERCLPHHPLLSGKSVAPADTALTYLDGMPVFCATENGHDLLACIFFALSRYEEYESFQPDAHGRFPAAASHAQRCGYLRRPMVREWTAAIGRRLRQWFPDLPVPERPPFVFRPTYDIDLLWAYRHRGWRGMASLVRDALTGHTQRALARLRSPPAEDAYFTLPRLHALHLQHALTPAYFWLLADGQDRRDPNPYPIPPEQIRHMRELDAHAILGIHPGYRSAELPEVMAGERQRMQEILGREVTASRQHFLRFRLPATFRQLEAAGITDEYSMGYADEVGWRAGTNLPYPWYDLERERSTSLTIHPFAAMDVTLRSYLGLSAQDAGAVIVELATRVGKYGGDFPLLWHNSSFAPEFGWYGWWEAYVGLVGQLSSLQDQSPD